MSPSWTPRTRQNYQQFCKNLVRTRSFDTRCTQSLHQVAFPTGHTHNTVCKKLSRQEEKRNGRNEEGKLLVSYSSTLHKEENLRGLDDGFPLQLRVIRTALSLSCESPAQQLSLGLSLDMAVDRLRSRANYSVSSCTTMKCAVLHTTTVTDEAYQ